MTHDSKSASPSSLEAARAVSFRSRLFSAVLLSALAAVTGCTHVAPYDRGRLAHPSMTDELETVAAAHVHAVHEGAAGGGSVAESGCGCN